MCGAKDEGFISSVTALTDGAKSASWELVCSAVIAGTFLLLTFSLGWPGEVKNRLIERAVGLQAFSHQHALLPKRREKEKGWAKKLVLVLLYIENGNTHASAKWIHIDIHGHNSVCTLWHCDYNFAWCHVNIVELCCRLYKAFKFDFQWSLP